jgi:GNAT superfamily N-acetyltransferase
VAVNTPEVAVLDAKAALAAINELAGVLEDCVAGGASVSFMPPFTYADAAAFFERVAADVARGDTVLLVARDNGSIVGTVQLGLALPPNQPHRADVKKLLVHRRARGSGFGAALMQCLEQEAKARGRTLLVLDTGVGGEAEQLYLRSGWTPIGVIPGYALWPDGRPCDTRIFFKQL